MEKIITKILLEVVILMLAATGCASYAEGDASGPPDPPSEEWRYLDISLDGKVSWESDSGVAIPIPELKVVLIGADGARTDSTHTNVNGRFLIEHRHVPVGYYWEKHLYVEVSDDREMDDPEGKARYETLRILKTIESAPDNRAFLTMDDITVKRIQPQS